MKAERLVLMGHSLGAVGCQLYLTNSGVGKFDALILTASAILRRYRNSSAMVELDQGAGGPSVLEVVFLICQFRCHHSKLDDQVTDLEETTGTPDERYLPYPRYCVHGFTGAKISYQLRLCLWD